MKVIKLYMVSLSLLLLSCGNETETATMGADTASLTEEALNAAGKISTQTVDSVCYLRVGGMNQEDTASLKIILKGNDVTGTLMYLPHQKDSRFGYIRGKQQGNIINAQWDYMAEGMRDSVAVSFKIEGNSALQKASSFDRKTGREYLSDTGSYSQRYLQTDCSNLPPYDIAPFFR